MAFRRRCYLFGAALIVTRRLRWRGAACSFAARQRPCIRAQAIEFASIAFRKGLARSNEGCIPNVLPLRTGPAARQFCHKCAYGRKSAPAWLPADSARTTSAVDRLPQLG